MIFPTIFLVFYAIFFSDLEIHAADINIDIHASNLTVTTHGSDIHLSTDEELQAFGISLETWQRYDESINSENFQKYGKPKEVSFRNPTPHGDKFTNSLSGSFSDPTVTKITVLNTRVLEHNTTQEVLEERACHNSFKNTSLQCTFALGGTRSNTINTSWSSNFGFPVATKIGLDVKVLNLAAPLSGDFHWGLSEKREQDIELGRKVNVTATARPGKSVGAYLLARRDTMKVAVDYAANVAGTSLAVYKDGSFSKIQRCANDVLLTFNSGKRDNYLQATQIIDITVYSPIGIEVRDLNTN